MIKLNAAKCNWRTQRRRKTMNKQFINTGLITESLKHLLAVKAKPNYYRISVGLGISEGLENLNLTERGKVMKAEGEAFYSIF